MLLRSDVVAAMIIFPIPCTLYGIISVKEIILSNPCPVIHLFSWPSDNIQSHKQYRDPDWLNHSSVPKVNTSPGASAAIAASTFLLGTNAAAI